MIADVHLDLAKSCWIHNTRDYIVVEFIVRDTGERQIESFAAMGSIYHETELRGWL